MRHSLWRPCAVLFVALAALLFSPAHAQAQERSLVAALSGGASGDQDGSGYVWLELNQGKGTICYEMAVRNTGPVSNLRLVELSSGKSVALLLNGVGTTSDCVTVDKQIIRQVRRNAEAYGVVVGTSQYPQGALSGELATPSAELLLDPNQPAPVAQAAPAGESGDIDWGAVDWASIDLAAVDWQNVQWDEIDWGAIDWSRVDLRDFDLEAIDWAAIDWHELDWEQIDPAAIPWEHMDLRALRAVRDLRGAAMAQLGDRFRSYRNNND